MKTIKFLTKVMMAAGLIIIVVLLYTGCKKDAAITPDPPQASASGVAAASDNSIASSSFDDVTNLTDEAMMVVQPGSIPMPVGERIQTSCANIKIDLDAMPHTLIINYGPTDCLGKDGNYRRGEIIVTWSGAFNGTGATRTITFNDYFVNFNEITGTIGVVENGLSAEGFLLKNITVNGSVIISPLYSPTGSNSTIVFNANLKKEMIKGEETPLTDRDDVFLLWGTADGVTQAGVPFSALISVQTPLRKEIGFMNFTSGVINITMGVGTNPITVQMNPTVKIDFSYLNSQRDNLAMVTDNGQTYLIQLNSGSFAMLK